MFNRARVVQLGITAAILTVSVAPARADIAWSVDAGAGHTDNAALTDSDKSADTLTSAGGTINYGHDSDRLQASLNGSGNYVHYVDNTYSDDFQSSAKGSVTLGIIPERLLWNLSDTFGQIAINQFEPVTPENRQNVNTLTTGPDFRVRLGNQSDVNLSATYVNTNYQETDKIDTQSVEGQIGFRRHLSESSSWAVIGSNDHIKYDAPGDPTYDQRAIYASWEAKGARQAFVVDVGANRIDIEDSSFTKPLVRVTWTRRLAPSWSMDVHARSEYENASQQFTNQKFTGSTDAAAIGISQAPAASYEGGAAFAFQRARTRFNVEGGVTRLDYVVDNGLNEKSWYGTVELSRRHTPRLEGFVNYRIDKRRYDDNPLRDDRRQRAGIGLDWRVGKDLFLTTGYQFNDSDSDSLTNRYKVNLLFLTVSYRQGSTTGARGFGP